MGHVLVSQNGIRQLLCCAGPADMLSSAGLGSPKSAMVESVPAMALKPGQQEDAAVSADQALVAHISPRKPKRSPQKARKPPSSSDPAAQPNGENYSYGDPRVEPLSQLSDIVTMDEPAADTKCVSLLAVDYKVVRLTVGF